MSACVSLYSKERNEISRFLNSYDKSEETNSYVLKWTKDYPNPVELADIIGVFIDNNDKYDINMWISLDTDFFINVTNYNANKIIRYLFERYPY